MTYKYKGRGLLQLTGKQMAYNQLNLSSPNIAIGSGGLSNVSLNTLTSGQLGSISLNSVFGHHDSNMHPEVKKYEIYEIPEDVLALSVAWKRLRDNGVHGTVGKLLDRELFSRVTPEDRTNANVIRDYYSKKVMMWKLRGIGLTRYRNDLNNFIHGDGMKVREDVFGMVYHLPQFYQYDTQLDSVREKVKSKNLADTETLRPGQLPEQTKVLEPITKIRFVNKKLKQNQYWFKDIATDGAVMLSIEDKNPLEHIWSHMFDTKDLLNVGGKFQIKEKDNFQYFGVLNWNLLKI